MMKQLLKILAAIMPFSAIAQAECRIISFEHFGGNRSDNIMFTGQSTGEPEDEFSFFISTLSTTGSISTACTEEIGGGTVIRKYSGDFSTLISETCAPRGSDFLHETTFFYPQPDGDTILIGYATDDYGSNDIAIERKSAAGEVLWNKHYGGSGAEAASRVALAADGSFLVLTGTNSTDGDVGFHYGSGFDADMWLVKIDTAGNLVWGKVLGGTSPDLLSTIIPSEDGGCYLFGASASSNYDAEGSHGGTDLWIVKLDGAGNKEWHKMLGGSLTDGSGYDNGVRAIRDSGTGFYVVGRTDSHYGDVQQRMPMGQEDLWLLHIDSLANILWENTYGGPGLQYSSAMCRGADGSIWMAGMLISDSIGGHITVNYADTDGWVVHADSMGNLLNQRVVGANKEEEIEVLQPLTDGSILAAGRYLSSINPALPNTPGFPDSGEGDGDVFVVRLSPDDELSVAAQLLPDATWSIYPNPSTGMVTIDISGQPNNVYGLAIYDAAGKVVYQHSIREQLSITDFKPASGMYTVQLNSKDGRRATKKLVITK